MSQEEQARQLIEAAARRAVEYWGTAHDEEELILAELAAAGLTVDRSAFVVMVEALIAVADADSNRDLSAYGWSATPSLDELAAFEDERRGDYASALVRILDDLVDDADVVPFPVAVQRAA